MGKHHWEVIRHTFSPRFVVALFYSFAYYIHEHVAWRATIHAEKDVRIHATASIRNAQNVYVGKNSHINHLCCIWAGDHSQIILGDNLLMGPGVCIFSGNHGMVKGQPMTFQERKEASIVIGDDVWVGAGATILKGAKIGSGSVVATGAVVLRGNYPPGSLIAGNPAKAVRQIAAASRREAPSTHDPDHLRAVVG